jgi:hypothetical protein
MFGGEAGYAHAFAQAPERSAAVLDGYAGIGLAEDHWGMGVGGTLRIKASDAIAQFSIAPFFYVIAGQALAGPGPRAAFFALSGVDLLTVESVANEGSVSIGSPFVEAGLFVRLFGDWGLAPAVSFEDDIRFNDIPNTGYVSFVLGFSEMGYEGLHLDLGAPAKPAKPDK